MAECRHCGKTLYVIGNGDENKFTCPDCGLDCWWPPCPIAEPMREPVYSHRPCPLPNANEGSATPDECATCPVPALKARAKLCDELEKALRRVQPQVKGVLCVQDVEAALDKYDKLKESADGK